MARRKKKSEMYFELVGGIFIVEKFPDGTEKREEIDGKVVLDLLLRVTTHYAEEVLSGKVSNGRTL